MPECVSVSEFVQEVQEDWSSPTTSSFTSKMINCRNTIYLLEEVSECWQREGRRVGGGRSGNSGGQMFCTIRASTRTKN
uniref:Uncharacterized protein n=1 Tax=Fundulus heteroclitus TaxID=8078 RepID=A0A3Q2NSJ8_FUNHE